ncbi:MAG: helix-turn-helix domain-containing protein [Gammaproteobacteria bacterium]|nr:helix-turn-helix domain-containing protein [Gammaproteobacteria bacterium]
MTKHQHDVFTVAELAEYLKVPKSTIYKLAQEGRLIGQKVGRHWRFHRDAVDRWLTESHPDPASGPRQSRSLGEGTR